jgi:hypothetical protein
MITDKYDIIGDVHGYAEVLQRLLRQMGYREDGGVSIPTGMHHACPRKVLPNRQCLKP